MAHVGLLATALVPELHGLVVQPVTVDSDQPKEQALKILSSWLQYYNSYYISPVKQMAGRDLCRYLIAIKAYGTYAL